MYDEVVQKSSFLPTSYMCSSVNCFLPQRSQAKVRHRAAWSFIRATNCQLPEVTWPGFIVSGHIREEVRPSKSEIATYGLAKYDFAKYVRS